MNNDSAPTPPVPNPIVAELATMSRPAKVILYVMGMIDELKIAGAIEGGHLCVTEKGDQYMAALHESGFEPTEEEVLWAGRTIFADAERAETEHSETESQEGEE